MTSEATNVARIDAGGTRQLVYGNDEVHRAWAAERIAGGARFGDEAVTIGVERGGTLCAVAIYNLFTDSSCHAHIASDGSKAWASPGVLAAIFAYPFRQCGVRRITLPIAASNRASLILAIKLGFQFEGRLIAGCGDEDEILLGMLAEDCHWIK